MLDVRHWAESRIISGGNDHTVKTWDVLTGLVAGDLGWACCRVRGSGSVKDQRVGGAGVFACSLGGVVLLLLGCQL